MDLVMEHLIALHYFAGRELNFCNIIILFLCFITTLYN